MLIKDILLLQNRIAYLRDEQAYKQLFYHFYTSLHRFAISIVHHNETAEEIVSDTMMNLWDLGTRLAQIEKLNLYLLTSVKNACLRHLSKKKLDTVQLSEHDFLAGKPDTHQTPESQLMLSEIEKRINESIKDLPPQCRMVYRLIKDESLSYKEVGGILNISQNTIETHMRIALRKIRLALLHYLSEK